MDQQPQAKKTEQKLKGALLTFIVLQLIYLFYFFSTFPESFSNALDFHSQPLITVASWLSSLTMLGYCIVCLFAVAQLVMRKHGFLLWFQISGAIALIGNFAVFVLRQIVSSFQDYYYQDGTYYWVLFIMALFWTVIWCMYFARSSRVFSYMGEDAEYLKRGLFTKNVATPTPWEEPSRPVPYAYRPTGQPVPPPQAAPTPPQGTYPAPPPAPPAPATPPYNPDQPGAYPAGGSQPYPPYPPQNG